MGTRWYRAILGSMTVVAVSGSAACSTGTAELAPATTTRVGTVATSLPTSVAIAEPTRTQPPASTAAPATTAPATTAPATTTPATTAPATTTPATTSTTVRDLVSRERIGTSVEGRPITAIRRGTGEGIPVVVIGVIHGDEAAGVAVIERLGQLDVPTGVDLWLVESINPDGQHDNRRTNANLVDLNRNFPHRWSPLQQPGGGQYSGPSPASEPETQAAVAFIERVRPALVIWYHQDLYRIAPGVGRAGEIRTRYASLTGLPLATISGGTYTGTAASWVRSAVTDTVAFIVELGPTLSASEADVHARAVVTIAAEL